MGSEDYFGKYSGMKVLVEVVVESVHRSWVVSCGWMGGWLGRYPRVAVCGFPLILGEYLQCKFGGRMTLMRDGKVQSIKCMI